MHETVPITARVEKALNADLTKIAAATGRSRSALINEALRSFVASERQFIEKVEAGLADLEAGRTADMETVVSAVRRAIRPNAETLEAIAELEAGKGKKFNSVDDLMADLNKEDES